MLVSARETAVSAVTDVKIVELGRWHPRISALGHGGRSGSPTPLRMRFCRPVSRAWRQARRRRRRSGTASLRIKGWVLGRRSFSGRRVLRRRR